MASLWGGRFEKDMDELVKKYNASIFFDQRMYNEDIDGSIAHVTMLGRQGIVSEEEKEQINETYNDYVESVTPKANLWLRMAKAFLVGGLICLLGQCIINIGKKYGLDDQTAASYCSLTLVFLSALLTGTGIYPVIASFGGAGALVPITGFANAVVSAAIEFKTEGRVLGTGAKMFIIAGPVIVYGTLAAVLYGSVCWLLQ